MQLSKSKLVTLFGVLDQDSDGKISANNINLAGIDGEDLTLISEVLFLMEDQKLSLSEIEFI